MGYTHYFQQKNPPTDEQWDNICNGFKHFFSAAMLYKPMPIQLEGDDPNPPLVDKEYIKFNGIGPLSHETMYLERDCYGFNFCKTNRKPYDFAVMVLLVLVNHFAADSWTVTSDGEPSNWQPAVDWMNSVSSGEVYSVPPGVTHHN